MIPTGPSNGILQIELLGFALRGCFWGGSREPRPPGLYKFFMPGIVQGKENAFSQAIFRDRDLFPGLFNLMTTDLK